MGTIFRTRGYVEIRESDLKIFRDIRYEMIEYFNRLAAAWKKDAKLIGAPPSHKQDCLDKAAKYEEMADHIRGHTDIDTLEEYYNRMDFYSGY